VSRRQANRWAEQEQAQYYQQQEAAPPPQQTGGGQDQIEQLKQLGELHAQGVLTDEEFAVQKAKILG
jgi:hypothetical protein